MTLVTATQPSPVPSRMAALHYGLAYLGVHMAFMPLLVLLVPRRIELLAPGQSAELLSWVLLAGACAAGAGNMLAGHLGDRWLEHHGNRRGLVAIGVVLLAASYGLLAMSGTFSGLLTSIVVYQLALNCAFAPLGALLADHFPDHTKGRMGGIMTAALPLSSLSVVLVGWLFPQDGAGAFVFAGALAVACFVPLLIDWRLGEVALSGQDDPAAPSAPWVPRDFAIAWGSKLAVQLGASFVQGYIYLYLVTLPAAQGQATALLALMSGPAALLAMVATLGAGFASDRLRRRRIPLAIASVALALGLVLLAQAEGIAMLLLGYAAFQAGLAAFSSVDVALIGQLVARQPNRGALLGIMNLTNTLPSAMAPVLTLLAVRQGALQQTLGELFLLCAGLTMVAGLSILRIRSVR
ncbi:MAG: MFS transporter [Alteraurantiacibacter sp.]